MLSVSRAGRPGGPAAGPRPAASAGGFTVAAEAATVSGPAATAPTAALDGLLQFQAMEDGATRDRHARRHGQALLGELAALQRALLGDADAATEDALLQRLSAMLEACPAASDPALASTMAGVVLRVQVELARRGR
jgi:hypothetical protein